MWFKRKPKRGTVKCGTCIYFHDRPFSGRIGPNHCSIPKWKMDEVTGIGHWSSYIDSPYYKNKYNNCTDYKAKEEKQHDPVDDKMPL